MLKQNILYIHLKKIIFIAIIAINIPCLLAASANDSKAPIDITANNAEFDDANNTAKYYGNVITTQGSRKLLSKTLNLYRNSNNKVNLILAKGHPAKFNFKLENSNTCTGSANIIKYYPLEDQAHLIGNAKITQNKDSITGAYLIYNFTTGYLISKNTANQRTHVTLNPNPK